MCAASAAAFCARGAHLSEDDVRDGSHGEAAVFDLHLLPAAVLLRHGGHQAERIPHAKRLGRANVALADRRHGDIAERRLDSRDRGRRVERLSAERHHKGSHDGPAPHAQRSR